MSQSIKDYIDTENTGKEQYLTAAKVTALPPSQRKAVITQAHEWVPFEEQRPEGLILKHKPCIGIEIDKKPYKWTLSKTAARMLAQELATDNTAEWVGALVSLSVLPTFNGTQTVVATVLLRPGER